MVNVAAIFSTLGNPNSLVPLAVKDITSTAAITGSSFITGKEEGQDRFIDEAGTLIIWLLGIPAFKWLFDNTVFKAYNLDSKFDVRNLKDKDVFEKIKQYAPSDEVKKNLEKISKKQGLFKNIALYKFFFATGATIASYIGLTKAKHRYTENKIKNNLIKEFNAQNNQDENKNTSKMENPSFKGVGEVVKNFAFSPVKNMWILDGAITTERLVDSRSPQEFAGYGIREGLYLLFMYYAGNKIQEALEKRADKKYNKSIGLDARVIEDGRLQKNFENGSVQKSLDEFKAVKEKTGAELYEFLIKNPENEVVKVAKESDIISMLQKPKKWYEIFKKAEYTDKVDTRKFIDLDLVKGTYDKLNTLYGQYKTAIQKGETSETFFKGVKKLKRGSIATNIGASIFALSIITPAAMLAKRFYGKDDAEFQTKKEIRNKLIEEGVIS